MNSIFIVLLIFSILFASTFALFSKVQSTSVKGVLTCDGEPARNVKLQLWDIDRTDPNDLMSEGITDSSGRFLIQGSEKEFTTIDPELRILHKCSNNEGRCYKKASLEIPDEYVSEGKTPTKVFDLGNLELKDLTSQDTKECN